MPNLLDYMKFAVDGSVLDNPQEPEHVPLFLPSNSLLHAACPSLCPSKLLNTEARLREAQAHEALDDLRRHLRTRTFANKYKVKDIVGQRQNIRVRSWQATIDRQAAESTRIYRFARTRLLELRRSGDWEKVLQVLEDDNIHVLNECVLTQREKEERAALQKELSLPLEGIFGQAVQNSVRIGEGRRMMSLIWVTSGGTGEDDNDPRTLDGEFCLAVLSLSSVGTEKSWIALRVE